MKYSYLLISFILLVACGSSSQDGRKANKLINESSPYLLQHAYNPVDWNPWNDAALAQAKSEDKMMVISVGYSSCHWCHVMEHESFEDSTVAAVMNEHFINVKVDREERPDVDNVYMTACHLMEQNCGWPLNVFTLPDGRPVWAGTYFPKDNWVEILNYFQKSYVEDRERMEKYADDLAKGLSTANEISFNDEEQLFTEDKLKSYTDKFLSNIDMKKGGREGVQKFPLPSQYEYLMRYGTIANDQTAIDAVNITLKEIANGGIYDHIDGGFARYSVDADWHVPHFEKMLYDNGQLVSLYSKAYQLTKDPLYKTRIIETLDFIDRQWTSKPGGIYSSYDADSENEFGHKEEGAFYVWRKEEVEKILGKTNVALAFMDYYDIRDKGNWESSNIPRITEPMAEVASRYNISELDLNAFISGAIDQLRSERSKRKSPGLDDKILTSWNALMLQGYIDAYRALGDERYKHKALKIAEFLKSNMIQSDYRLLRNHKDGKSVINAFLEDYALLASSYLSLYEITFDESWLGDTKGLLDYADLHFYNAENQMYSYTSDEDSPLIAETNDYSDNVLPGSNSTMASVLFKLGTYLNDKEMLDRSRQMLHNVIPSIDEVKTPGFYNKWLSLYLDITNPPYEVAILGDDFEDKLKDLQSNYIPNAIFLGGRSEGDLELLKNKLIEGETMIYVCKNKVCKLPTDDVGKALELMK